MGICLTSQNILDVGDVLIKDGIRFRVLSFQKEVILYKMNSGRKGIQRYDMDEILEGIKSGLYIVEPKTVSRILINDEDGIYKQRKNLIRDIGDKYHGDYVSFIENHSRDTIELLKEKHSIKSENTILRIVHIYMNSGYDETSLLPYTHQRRNAKKYKNTTGSKTANASGVKSYIITIKDKEALEYAIRKYIENNELTIEEAHSLMLYKYYSHMETNPESGKETRVINGVGECPSVRQLDNILGDSTTALITKSRKGRGRRTNSISYIDPKRFEHMVEA